MTEKYIKETNKFKRLWISLWYHDTTRLLVMMGFPVVITFFILKVSFELNSIPPEVYATQYVLIFCWMMIDNNYSNLRRIGLDEYRKKL